MQLNSSHIEMLVRAIRAVLPMKEPADAVLRNFFREHHQLGAHDRALVAETIFALLRRRRLAEHLAGEPTPRRLALVALVRLQGHNVRELEAAVSEQELKWLREMKGVPLGDLPPAVVADLPDWLYERLRQFMSDDEVLQMARGFQQSAPLDLRVNHFRVSRDEVLQKLASEGIEAAPMRYSPIGVRLAGKPAINRSTLFTEGLVEVQDEGSQLLGYLVAPKRSDMVVDFCAGAGGKTLLLGALMHSKGRIYAFDVSEKRLNNLKPRLKRSGLSNLHPQLIAHEHDTRIKRLARKIDRVLVDAPCSGLGTLRRNPDLKWRQSPESIEELKAKQRSILAAAATLVKPGGRLVYATCSILPEENQDAVTEFLAAHPDFSLTPANEVLAQQRIELDTGEYLALVPHVHSTDGFFAAVLDRAK